MRWLDSVPDSMDMNVSKLQEIVEDSATIRNRLDKVYLEKNGTMLEYKRKK